MEYFISKKYRVSVEKNTDGTLLIKDVDTKEPITDAGLLICSVGGIDKFLAHCLTEAKFQEIQTFEAYKKTPEYQAQLAEQRAASMECERLAQERKNTEIEKEYKDLLYTYGGVIPTTVDNLKIVLRYLNTKNWGGWELPKMTIGYSASQYDCEGKQATAIKLEQAIDDGYDGKSSRFCVGAPRGHLNKYTRI